MDKKVIKNYIINIAAIVAVYAVLKGLIYAGVITRYHQGIIVFILINVILATSLNLAVGFLGQLTLGHAGFMAVGAYVSAITAVALNANFNLPKIVVLLISLTLAAIVSALTGVAIGIPALRLRGDYLAIITLGFGEVIRVIINNIKVTGGAQGFTGIPKLSTLDNVFWITVLAVAFLYTLTHSRQGRAILSIREDEIAAEAVGVKTTSFKVMGFAIAAGLAGIGGGLYAHYIAFLDPNTFNFMRSVEILIIVVLGGMGSLTGSIVAAIVLTIMPEALRSFNELRLLLYALILVVMMIFKPSGLFGTEEFSWQGIYDRYKTRKSALHNREKKV
ncbi:MAG: branched-chain amino acid transport system permease protein [Clostridiales bacterium]|nr:branched-chain amino acid transport system permease protein [Clostridiales bacterium]